MNAFERGAAGLLFWLHRWLGAGIGLLMLLWCLSGFVMMYVAYPSLAERERLMGLPPIQWTSCCDVGATSNLANDDPVLSFSVEMLGPHPTIRIDSGFGPPRIVDLVDGRRFDEINELQAMQVARDYGRQHGIAGTPVSVGLFDYDQWTVNNGNAGPYFRFAFGDAAKTELYVSHVSGKAVQRTTASQRFWNWLGAVPHWLYFAQLRKNGELWAQIVIWTSLIGTILTLLGLYIGILQASQARRQNKWSPYSGFLWWHHLPALCFGVFTFIFVLSGFFSMNPWGLFETASARQAVDRVEGEAVPGLFVRATASALAEAAFPGNVVSITSERLDGKLYLVATTSDGARMRYDFDGEPAPLAADELKRIAIALTGDARAPAPQLLMQADSYYFDPHGEIDLPVYRVSPPNEPATRYYLDPVSGALLYKIDASGKWYRWLFEAPHRLDFSPAIRARPLWDIVMLLLMGGVTFVCATGAYLGVRLLVGRRYRRSPRP